MRRRRCNSELFAADFFCPAIGNKKMRNLALDEQRFLKRDRQSLSFYVEIKNREDLVPKRDNGLKELLQKANLRRQCKEFNKNLNSLHSDFGYHLLDNYKNKESTLYKSRNKNKKINSKFKSNFVLKT